jgi:hypothetical protein
MLRNTGNMSPAWLAKPTLRSRISIRGMASISDRRLLGSVDTQRFGQGIGG